MRYAAFVFDFDGVLADSVEVKTDAFRALYAEYGPDVAGRVVAHHRAHGGMTRREKFVHYHREFLGRELAQDELEALCREFSSLAVDRVVAAPEIAGCAAFLDRWRGRVPMFVDSAAPDDELGPIVERRGLTGYFERCLGASQGKADNLAAIIEGGGFAPGDVLFLGDAGSDLKAARACGTAFVGIVPGPDAPLVRSHPDIDWVRDFNELQTLLEQRGAQ